jgi:hypothetical protein
MTEPPIYTLCDVEINVSLLTFAAYFWEVTSFFRPFLNDIQLVKEDPTIAPWALVNEAAGEVNSGHYFRSIVAQHKIPGFSWLPWLPMYINSVKREVIDYSTESRELTIQETSKVEGIPWHDIDVNLTWKVYPIGEQTNGQGSVRVVVTVVVIFQTPSFIQAFAEAQAVTEMLRYFVNWNNEAKRAAEENHMAAAQLAPAGEGPLARITAAICGDKDKLPSRLGSASSCGDLRSLSTVYVSQSDEKGDACVYEETATASTSSESRQSSNNGDINPTSSGGTSSTSMVLTKQIADGWFVLITGMRRWYRDSVEQLWELLGLDGGSRERIFAFDCHHRCRT